MSVEEVKVYRYTTFFKDYAQFYEEQNGVDRKGAQLMPVTFFCDMIATMILSLRCVEEDDLELLDYRVLIQSAIQLMITACLKLKDEDVFGGMGWIKDYKERQREDDLTPVMGKHLHQAAKDAHDYSDSVPAEDEIEKKCRLVVRFLARALREYKSDSLLSALKADSCSSTGIKRPAVQSSDPVDVSDQLTSKRAYQALDAGTKSDIVLYGFSEDFRKWIIDNHLNPHMFYIRGIGFLQSSGFGKSRLLRNIGRSIPSFHIVAEESHLLIEENFPTPGSHKTRIKTGSSFPLPDREVCKFFLDHRIDYKGSHVAAAFLSALFIQLYIYIAIGYVGTAYLELTCYSPQSEEVWKLAMANLKAARKHMNDLIGTKDLASGVLDRLRLLQPAFPSDERVFFLSTVVDLAKALLELNKEKLRVRRDAKAYIRLTKIESSIINLFQLIDGVSDGSMSGTSDATSSGKPHQFIFGLDNCGFMDDLFEISRDKREGLKSFARVYRDLELINSDKKANHPTRRVWLAMAGSNVTELLSIAPESHDESIDGEDGGGRFCGAEQVVTFYTHFGMDHSRRQKLGDDENYYLKMTMGQMHHLDHLKVLGRGLWSADNVAGEVMQWALIKLLQNPHESSQSWNLSNKKYDPKDRKELDTLTFAIASLRVGLGEGKLQLEPAIDVVMEAVNKHLRTVMRYLNEYYVDTTTPSEPVLATAALLILNYGFSLFAKHSRGWCMETYHNEYGYCAAHLPRIEWDASRNDISWTNMLLETGRFIRTAHDNYLSLTLFSVGCNGELAGRFILTRARDCTLPKQWGSREKIPYTTVERFFEELVGEEQAKEILATASDPALSQALLNFVQFNPLDFQSMMQAIVGEDRYYKEVLMMEEILQEAFVRCSAFYCPSGPKRVHAMIPIAIPKKPKVEMDGDVETLIDQSLLTDYRYSYIAVYMQAQDTPYTDPLEWYPIVGIDGRRDAAAVVLMDMLVEEDKKFVTDPVKCPGRVSDHVTAEIVTDSMLEVRIRGVNCAYHRFAEVDSEGIFEKQVRQQLRKEMDLCKYREKVNGVHPWARETLLGLCSRQAHSHSSIEDMEVDGSSEETEMEADESDTETGGID